MASKGSPNEEDNKVKGSRPGRGGRRKRFKFTKEDLQILNESFEQNPYPDFTAREELANQIHCDLCIIEYWFQNKRSRLSPRKKQRAYAARNLHDCPLPGRPPSVYQNSQLRSAHVYAVQTSHGQKSLRGRASRCFFMHKWQSHSKPDGSYEFVVPDIKTEPSDDGEYGGGAGSEPSLSSGKATYCIHPIAPLKNLERDKS